MTTTIIGAGILLLIIALAAVYVTVTKQWNTVLPQLLFALVTDAERQYSSGTGKLKFAKVLAWLMPYVPAVLKPFITTEKLSALIENALAAAKLSWSGNPALLEGVNNNAEQSQT